MSFSLEENIFSPEECHSFYTSLRDEIPWRQEQVTVFGKTHQVPRLCQWFGEPGKSYLWSGVEMSPLPWTSRISEIRERVEEKTQRRFNSVLLNYYRDGKDTVGWHSDDEPELGSEPFIASVSFGTLRDFYLRDKITQEKIELSLKNGSLLSMWGNSQQRWEHSLPRRLRIKEGRINLTFRTIFC
jgi:alkylated DNA repair dioxygenase AlkB